MSSWKTIAKGFENQGGGGEYIRKVFKLYSTDNGGVFLTSDLEDQLNELVDRVDYLYQSNAREQAVIMRRLKERGLTLREIAKVFGLKNASSVNHRLLQVTNLAPPKAKRAKVEKK